MSDGLDGAVGLKEVLLGDSASGNGPVFLMFFPPTPKTFNRASRHGQDEHRPHLRDAGLWPRHLR
jgi:hypothetical protein